jgi:hypothetical protein
VLTLGARIEEPAAFVAKLNDLLVTLTREPENAPEPPQDAPEPPQDAAGPPPAGEDG